MEHVVVAIWRDAGTSRAESHAHLRTAWAPQALATEGVEALSLGLALDDQGRYGPPPGAPDHLDALVDLGLAVAHDLDAVPARDLLHHGARRVEAWRVEVHRPRRWERTGPDGEPAPGLELVSLMRRAEGLSRQQFARHWTERHAPLALRHHPGLRDYRQNVVRRALTPGGDDVDGIAELHFASRDDFEQRFFDSDAGRAVILDDVARFMDRAASEGALMTELPLRTPA